jgi:hypothetical protein
VIDLEIQAISLCRPNARAPGGCGFVLFVTDLDGLISTTLYGERRE